MARKAKSLKNSRFGGALHRLEIVKAYGDEPSWEGVKVTDPNYREFYTCALNWGNSAFENSVLREVALKFFKDDPEKEFLKDLPEYAFHSIGLQCWLRLANAPLLPENETFFSDCLSDLKIQHEKFKEENDKLKAEKEIESLENKKLSAEQEAKVAYVEVMSELDNMIVKNDVRSDEVYDLLRKKTLSLATLRLLQNHYSENVEDADKFNIKNLKPNMTVKKYVNNLRDYSAAIVMQVAKILNNTKAEQKLDKTRRPRRKKIKPVNMQIKNLQFKERDESLKVVSIPPTSLVHAQTLVVFNTKTRKVGMYYAKNVDGLTIKGTTIQNYDEEKSTQKTLRKPEEMIPHLTELSVKRYEKVFEGIKAVETKMTGRVNSDTLLLKVFKVK